MSGAIFWHVSYLYIHGTRHVRNILCRGKCSRKEYITIPFSNCSQSVCNSWFVSYFTRLPSKKAKSLAPIVGVGGRIGQNYRQDKHWQGIVEASAASKSTLQFCSPTIVKVFVLSLLPIVCLPKKRNRWHR